MRLAVGLMLLLSGCQQGETVATVEPANQIQAKLLATVFMSPTPNEAEQQATRIAVQPALTSQPPTPPPTATIYVGVFLQGADTDEGEAPMLDATQVFALLPGLATERPSRCQIPADTQFGDGWRNDPFTGDSLGCAIEDPTPFTGVVQVFERGVMYFQAGGPVWAIETTDDGFPNRHWTITQSLPMVENPELVVTEPQGLKVPLLGFGAVWFGVQGVRDTLGFARTDEQQAQLVFQRFEGGTLFRDISSDTVFVLLPDGRAFGPF
jgi:hypothetical protein